MRISQLRFLMPALAAATAVAASAQTQPPIKPGLWQVQSERTVDGKKAPDLGEQMKTMSPDMRKRMETMMHQHGVDMSGPPGQMKMCLTRESLDQGKWQGLEGQCKTDFSTRSSTLWKWHSSCGQPAVESDGESSFDGPENYRVKSTTTMTMQGKTRISTMAMTGKWLGTDCGDLKPVMPPTLPPIKDKK